MRERLKTLRLPLLGIVIVACLAGASGPSLRRACAEETAGPSLAEIPARVRQSRPLVATAHLSPRLNPLFGLVAHLTTAVDEAGNSRRDLWVTNLQSMRSERLTSYSQCFDVAWSGDGTWLAVSAQRLQSDPPRAGLYLMRADGTAMREVVSTSLEDVPTSPAWQPGKPDTIAFISSMGTPAFANPLRRHIIWVFNTAGTGPEALTCFSLPDTLSLSPRSGITWSSDGKNIYFLAQEEVSPTLGTGGEQAGGADPTAIWSLSVAEGSARKIMEEPYDYKFTSLAAAPTPAGAARPRELLALLLSAKRRTASAEAYVSLLPLDGSGVRRLGSTLLPSPELRIDYTSCIGWDGTGRRLAYVRESEIWTMELATPAEAATLDCQDNLAALYRAFADYAKQHDGLLPSPEQDKEGNWRAGGFFWIDALAPFLQRSEALKCNPRETEPSGYLFNRDLWGKGIADVGAIQQSPLLTEAQGRHDGRRNVLLLNGAVRLEAG